MDGLLILWQDTGLANFQWQQLVMIAVGCLLLYLAIVRQFEPLLLLPIGFGAILPTSPMVDSMSPVDCSITSMRSVLPPAFSHS